MVGLGAAAFVTFGISNPFIALGSERFMTDFTYELRHSATGHPGFTTPSGFLYHLQTTLPLGIGWLVLALAALGLGPRLPPPRVDPGLLLPTRDQLLDQALRLLPLAACRLLSILRTAQNNTFKIR
jgi:hypothetical protein